MKTKHITLELRLVNSMKFTQAAYEKKLKEVVLNFYNNLTQEEIDNDDFTNAIPIIEIEYNSKFDINEILKKL